MRCVGHGVLLAETAGGERSPAFGLGEVDLGEGVRVSVDQRAAAVGVVLALLCGGVDAVSIAVDESDRA